MDVYQRRRLVALSAIAVVFILFVLLIRSCGGDDDEATPTPLTGATGTTATVLTQVDYAAQADPICLQANTLLASVDEADPVQADNDKAEIVAGELQQLQTLPPPDDGTDQLNDYLSALEKQSAAYADRATANERGDSAQVVELDATIDETVTDAATAAEDFGFEACGDLSKVGDASTGGGGGGGDEGTDTGGTETPTEPVTPTTTTPVPVAPPVTDGGGTATPAPVAPADDGGGDSSSGGVSP